MKFVGITKIRNEEKIIQHTLDHVSNLVDEIYVYDDCSTDDTVEICKSHKAVKGIIEGNKWDNTTKGRNIAEGLHRQKVLNLAKENNADWVYCFDADEIAYFENLSFDADYYFLRLFDFYITEEDKNDEFHTRKFMGPEFRDIPMIFKVNPKLIFSQRIPKNHGKNRKFGGFVKHYGKAISIKEWEQTCDYYVNIRWANNHELQERWRKRKGKAIHTKSDFGRELITWEERNNKNKIIKI